MESENASKWKPKEKADLMIGFSYMCYGLAGLLVISDLFSLFLTGNFRLKRFIVDISFIGWGMLSRYMAARYRGKG
jgi:hypothetical protein